MAAVIEETWVARDEHHDWTAAQEMFPHTAIDFNESHAQPHCAHPSIVPCPPPMPTPEELSPVNTTPSSPNSVQSVESPLAYVPDDADKDAESNEDGNYSDSEDKPRKRRGRKRKLGTDDPEELKAIHNLNEKKRRADQRRLFSQLRKVVPGVEEQAQKTTVLQRVYEYLRQQEHMIEVQRKKLLSYELQLGIPQEKVTSPKGTASARAARGARRTSVCSEA